MEAGVEGGVLCALRGVVELMVSMWALVVVLLVRMDDSDDIDALLLSIFGRRMANMCACSAVRWA